MKTSCQCSPISIDITIGHYFQDLLQGTFHQFFSFNPLLAICRFVSRLKLLLSYLEQPLPEPVCSSCIYFKQIFNSWRSCCCHSCLHRGKVSPLYQQAVICKSFIKQNSILNSYFKLLSFFTIPYHFRGMQITAKQIE